MEILRQHQGPLDAIFVAQEARRMDAQRVSAPLHARAECLEDVGGDVEV